MIPHTDLLITNNKDSFSFTASNWLRGTLLYSIGHRKISQNLTKCSLHTSVVIAANGYINPNPNWKIGRKG